MPIVRRVFALLLGVVLAAVAAGVFTSCGGDGGEADLLAAGEYDFSVSGSLELEFPAATTSAPPMGAGQTQDTEISGDVTLKMNDDGSIEFKRFGIEATVHEDGGSADLNLSDSPTEGSTGKTGKDGTQADIYWQADLKNREERSATNGDTIGGSSPDPPRTRHQRHRDRGRQPARPLRRRRRKDYLHRQPRQDHSDPRGRPTGSAHHAGAATDRHPHPHACAHACRRRLRG